jgi:hypothetical protein
MNGAVSASTQNDGSSVEDAVHVVEDFLRDPSLLRRFALEAEYLLPPTAETYAGRNSRQKYPLPGLEEYVQQVTGHAVVPAGHPAAHAHLRLCLEGETGTGGVHIDNCHWTGVLYLTLDEHAQGGTTFHRHRPSNTLRAPVYPEDWLAWGGLSRDRWWKEVVLPHTNDPTKWDVARHVEMRFNRLVLFRPWLWHSASPGFGSDAATGRLVYLIFLHDAP